MKTRRPADRKVEILDAALALARQYGYQRVTRDAIAAKADCSPAIVSKHFGTMVQLRRAIMSAAVVREDLNVIAQGLAAGDSKARAAKPEVRKAALERLL